MYADMYTYMYAENEPQAIYTGIHRRRHVGARAPAGNAVPRLVPRLEKYWHFYITSRQPEHAPFRDHHAPAVLRLVQKAFAATAGI